MLRAIVSFSLRFRGIVVALACVLLAYGLYVTSHAKLDVFPDFVQPQVAIQTESPGLSSEQVELLVTQPLESAVNGLGGMESLRSESIEGLSIITVVFKEGSDIFRSRQMLAEILSEVSERLPTTVKAPRMTPLTSSTMDLLKIGLVSDKLTPMQLRNFADWTLKPRLLGVPGVAKCSSFGGEVRQFQVQVLPEQLRARALGLSDVVNAARAATGVVGAGFVESSNQRITIQTEGQALSPEILGEVPVTFKDGVSVRLKDVAVVREGPEPKFGDAVIMGRWGVLMTMSSQYGANTMEVTKDLEKALAELKPVLDKAGVSMYGRLHRPATFIETALRNMRSSLLLGATLVAVVLFLLLGSVRTALISLAAIPLSLLTAVLVMEKLGITINTITLGGLVIALGEVVDDSIIDVENIFRRLRENKRRPDPLPLMQVVLSASLEVRSAVVFATFVVALVFLPVLTLTGLQGSFFSPLALSYILAILASLAVALTVTPALALLFFWKHPASEREPWLQHRLRSGYQRVLRGVSGHPVWLIGGVCVLCVFAATRIPSGGEFLPDFREGHLVLQVFTTPGTSLPEMVHVGKQVCIELLKNPHIATVEQQVGRAELGEDPWGPHRSEFHVELVRLSAGEEEKVPGEIRQVLQQIPGIQFEILTFLGDRIGETISGETSPVVVNVFGDDLDLLDQKALEVAAVLQSIPGNADVRVKTSTGSPRLMVRLRPEKLVEFGFRPLDVLEAIRTSYQGLVVGQVHEANQVTDISVILQEDQRRDPESIGSLLLRSDQGVLLPLSRVADIYPTSGRFSILHEGARRRQVVTCSTQGRDVASFVEQAIREVKEKVKFTGQTYPVFSGAAQAKAKAQKELLLHSSIAAIGILMLLFVAFRQWRNLLLVLANAPFALVGGVLAVWVTGLFSDETAGLTIGSLVGFVTLFGITTRNSIMMMTHFEHLVSVEGMTWGPEAAMRGAGERLMPILMTATVTALGLLPLALGSGEAGREIEGPMAIVILGGLMTSTTLNLIILPSLALRFGRFGSK